MSQRKPVPILSEDQHSNYGHHIGMTSSGLQGNCNIPTSSVYDSLGKNGTKFDHNIFMFVCDNFSIKSTEVFNLGTSSFRMLDHDECRCDKSCSTDIVDIVIGHGLDDSHGLARSGSGTSNSKGKCCSIPYSWNI